MQLSQSLHASPSFVLFVQFIVLANILAQVVLPTPLGPQNKKGARGSIYKDEAISIHKKLALKSFEAPYRVVLIWMPEQMIKNLN